MSSLNSNEPIFDSIIIGAGLTGCLAANKWASEGKKVLLVDKGRGVGGRFSSKRFNTGDLAASFNHGIESFSISNENSKITKTEWFKNWESKKFVTFDDENAEWKIVGKSSDLIKALLISDQKQNSKIDLRLSYEANQIKFDDKNKVVSVRSAADETVYSRHLVVTAPAPQCLKLMSEFISESEKTILQKITYTKKLIVFGLNHLNEMQMIKFSDEISEKYFELNESEILHHLNHDEPQLRRLQSQELKKWRYAKVKTSTPLSSDKNCLTKDFWTIYSDGFGPSHCSSFENAVSPFV